MIPDRMHVQNDKKDDIIARPLNRHKLKHMNSSGHQETLFSTLRVTEDRYILPRTL